MRVTLGVSETQGESTHGPGLQGAPGKKISHYHMRSDRVRDENKVVRSREEKCSLDLHDERLSSKGPQGRRPQRSRWWHPR